MIRFKIYQKTTLSLLCLLLYSFLINAQDSTTTIYLFPGQGADYRLFNNQIWKENYDTVHIHLPTPTKDESMQHYAQGFINKIDTTESYILMGVSLGGMICTELSTMLKPQQTIIISSAKNNKELPKGYTIQKKLPLLKIIPKNYLLRGALLMQMLVEPNKKEARRLFNSMLAAKDPDYLKRTIYMIIHWERDESPPNIIHIHGTLDHTIPYKNVAANYIIEGGRHMMVYTKADEVNEILNSLLE